MSTFILNAFLILIILVPMIYFFLGGKKHSEEMKNFIDLATKENLSTAKSTKFHGSVLGIDKNKKCLYFTDNNTPDQLQVIPVKDIVKCEVIKQYSKEHIHDTDFNSLKKVSLQVNTEHNNKVLINIYDSNAHPSPDNSIIDAMEWEKVINNLVQKK